MKKKDLTRERLKNARVAWDVAGRVLNVDLLDLIRTSGNGDVENFLNEKVVGVMKAIATVVESDLDDVLEGLVEGEE